MNELLTTAITLIVFFIGYYTGKQKSPIPPGTAEKVSKMLKSITERKVTDVGPVERPTAHEIDLQNKPLIRAEEEAMKETFDQIIPKP